MVTTQTLGLPMRLATSSSILLCPGFPPSPLLRPFASRVLPYIHDDFLLTRRDRPQSPSPALYGRAFQASRCAIIRVFSPTRAIRRRKLAAHCRSDARSPCIGHRSAMCSACNRRTTGETQRAAQAASSGRARNRGAAEELLCSGENVSALRAQGFPARRWTSSAGRAGATTGEVLNEFTGRDATRISVRASGETIARRGRHVHLHVP